MREVPIYEADVIVGYRRVERTAPLASPKVPTQTPPTSSKTHNDMVLDELRAVGPPNVLTKAETLRRGMLHNPGVEASHLCHAANQLSYKKRIRVAPPSCRDPEKQFYILLDPKEYAGNGKVSPEAPVASTHREHGGGNPNHDANGKFAVNGSEPVIDRGCWWPPGSGGEHLPKAPRIKKPSLKKEGFIMLKSGTAAEISQVDVSAHVDARRTTWRAWRDRNKTPEEVAAMKPISTVNCDFLFVAAFKDGPVDYDPVAKVIRLRPTA